MALIPSRRPEKDLVVRIHVAVPGAKPVESWVGVSRADFRAIAAGAVEEGGLWIRLDPSGLELSPGPGIAPEPSELRFEPTSGEDESAAAPDATAPSGADTPLQERHILVVEDEDVISRLIREWLRDEQATVETCANGREALERVRAATRSFDLVVADVVMPGLGGRDLAVAIRHDSPGTGILLMSGYPTEQPTQSMHITRDLPFIAKPYRRADFLDAARAALGHA